MYVISFMGEIVLNTELKAAPDVAVLILKVLEHRV